MLNNYLRAFNENGGAGLAVFLRDNFELPKDKPEILRGLQSDQLGQRKLTGGYDLRGIANVGSNEAAAYIQSRTLGTWSRLTIYLAAEPPNYKKPTLPYRLVGMGTTDIAAPEKFLPQTRLSDHDIAARLGRLLDALEKADNFTGTVFVARQGKPVFAHSYGLANRSWNAPNTLETRFNLASITKMFTAVAVAQLAEHGKLSYDDLVGKVLPDCPNKAIAEGVTIRQLLSHTSGMIGARDMAEKLNAPPTARTIDDQVRPFINEPLALKPGERFNYSNAGFILLGRIIEKCSGQTYYDYVRDHVFRPAGMLHSGFLELDIPAPNIATGYEDAPGKTRRDNIFDLSVIGSPAGGAYATAGDMDRFGRALMAGSLVKPATLAVMWTGVTKNAQQNSEYGLGATIERYHGQRIISHGGGWKGITNHFEFYPELGVTVTVLSNIDDDPNAIANKVREWLAQGTRD